MPALFFLDSPLPFRSLKKKKKKKKKKMDTPLICPSPTRVQYEHPPYLADS